MGTQQANQQFDLFLSSGSLNLWTDFVLNECGYQSRELPGLDARFFVAQQSVDRFDVVEADRGHTRATVVKKPEGWELRVEGTVKQLAKDVFQTLFPVGTLFPSPQIAILAFNDALVAWERPAGVTLGEYVRFHGTPEVHRIAVMSALSSAQPVPADVLADYPDLTAALDARSQGVAEAIKEGQQVIFTPNKGEFTDALFGTVVEIIKNQSGGKGYHILTADGLQHRVWENQGEITQADPWRMTRETFFNYPELVAQHIDGGGSGYRVSYEYVNPHGAGPFKGSMTMVSKPAKGDVINAMFGKAAVTAVSKAKPRKLDNLELYEGGKIAHLKIVTEALAAGTAVPREVLADYPDLGAPPTSFSNA